MQTVNQESTDAASGVAQAKFDKIGSVAVGRGPIADVATDTSGRTLVVTNYGDDSVSLVDTHTLSVDATVGVRGEPFEATVVDRHAHIGIASANYDAVSVIDMVTKAPIATYALTDSLIGVAVDPDGKRIYVSTRGRDSVQLAAINTTTDEIDTIELAHGAGISVDAVRTAPDGQRLYAAVSGLYGGKLVIVDAHAGQVVRAVTIGSPIRDIAVAADGRTVYALTCDPRRGGAITIVDAATTDIAATVEIGGFPLQMALSSDGTQAYVVDIKHVAVVCTVTMETVGTIGVGTQASCVVASPDGARLYVADDAGVVTALRAAPTTLLPAYDVMATEMLPAPAVREMEPAGV
ncbi:YncE family protein [Mycobacterium sp.]|jgi:YVTN family beta-propeller protein|uniref:YncE family protein n=1 Tax=Mycobacterium sp. TaxID=1785 RepID=UPI002D502654|nr:YncE family protein [Mycobacterium sp.]HZA09137.1 YncE family protein [Mycobacterium sp.]